MGNIGDPFSTSVPAVGTAGTAYASAIDDILQETVNRLSSPVPVGSLINDNEDSLDLNNGPLNNAQYVQFYEQGSSPSGAPYGRVVYYAGNFYFVTSSGAIQVTDGAALNAAGIGGIVGDYGGVNPAKVAFVDATKTYEFYDDESLAQWGYTKAARSILVDQSTSRTVTIKPSTAISASYSAILPPAPPAAGYSLMTMTDDGTMSFAELNAVVNIPSIGDGLKHSDVTQWYPAAQLTGHETATLWAPEVNSGSLAVAIADTTTNAPQISTTSGAFTANLLVPAPLVGRRIKKLSARVKIDSGTGTATITVSGRKYVDGSGSAIGSNGTSSTVGSAVTVSMTATETVAEGNIYRVAIQFTTTGTLTNVRIYSIGVTYDYV